MALDIVIPYLKKNSGELEACLALIDKHIPHRKIHIVSNNEYSHATPHINVIMKLKWAIENLDLTDEFYLFNDDFFVMNHVDGIPYYHKGSLADQITSRRGSDFYARSLQATQAYLDNNALSYELHLPFLFDKHLLYALIELLDPENNRECPLIRTYYGNMLNVGGRYMRDVKNIQDFTDKTYLSTTESSFLRQPIGNYIRSRL